MAKRGASLAAFNESEKAMKKRHGVKNENIALMAWRQMGNSVASAGESWRKRWRTWRHNTRGAFIRCTRGCVAAHHHRDTARRTHHALRVTGARCCVDASHACIGHGCLLNTCCRAWFGGSAAAVPGNTADGGNRKLRRAVWAAAWLMMDSDNEQSAAFCRVCRARYAAICASLCADITAFWRYAARCITFTRARCAGHYARWLTTR